MPDRKNAIERELPGESTETTSSDSYVARQYESIRQEVEGTSGQIIDVDPKDVLRTKVVTNTPETNSVEISRLPYDGYPLPESILTSKVRSLSDFARLHTAVVRIGMLVTSEKKKAA